MGDWSIVVPSGDPANLRHFLESIDEPEERVVAVVGREFPREGFGVRFVDRGPGPFIFSRSVNRGVAAVPEDDLVLMSSDDVSFCPRSRPSKLVELARVTYGRYLIHPAVHGNTLGHPELAARGRRDIVLAPSPCPLPFVVGVISPRIRTAVGSWDETFTGYGYEDHDYVRRADAEGFRYLIYHDVEVKHSESRSVYRRRRDFRQIMRENRARYTEKWGEEPMR